MRFRYNARARPTDDRALFDLGVPMRLFAVLALPLLLTGCHAKFKKEAPTLGEVRAQIVVTGEPYVELGKLSVGGDGVIAAAAAVVNVVQEVKEVDQTKRIARAVKVDDVNEEFRTALADTLGDGPPFAYTTDKDAHLLQLEVLSYGLEVPSLGAAGVFTYDLRARIYKKNGDRVYSARTSCTTAAGNPSTMEQVLGVVNNVKNLKEMSNAEINEAFKSVARWCGQDFVTKMRRHAG
jgi:hypothetical protein